MRSLIWAFAVCICPNTHFLVARPIFHTLKRDSTQTLSFCFSFQSESTPATWKRISFLAFGIQSQIWVRATNLFTSTAAIFCQLRSCQSASVAQQDAHLTCDQEFELGMPLMGWLVRKTSTQTNVLVNYMYLSWIVSANEMNMAINRTRIIIFDYHNF